MARPSWPGSSERPCCRSRLVTSPAPRPKPCKEIDEMKSLIRYKPESADENQRLIEKVYEELAARDPGGIRYATLRLEDGVSFIHIFMTDSDDTPNALGGIAAFAEFQREPPQRCVDLPVAQAATVIGSYRLLSG